VAHNAGSVEEPRQFSQSLGEALGIENRPNTWILFRDVIRNREYLRPAHELAEQGFAIDLHGYEYRVFLDFRPVSDETGLWAELASRTGSEGSDDMGQAYRRLQLEPALAKLRLLADAKHLIPYSKKLAVLAQSKKMLKLGEVTGREIKALLEKLRDTGLLSVIYLHDLLEQLPEVMAAEDFIEKEMELPRPDDQELIVQEIARELVANTTGKPDWRYTVHLARFLSRSSDAISALGRGKTTWLGSVLADPAGQELLGLNRHDGQQWLNKEALEMLLQTMATSWLLQEEATNPTNLLDGMALILEEAKTAGYRVREFQKLLDGLT
jgi:hypothetical protein